MGVSCELDFLYHFFSENEKKSFFSLFIQLFRKEIFEFKEQPKKKKFNLEFVESWSQVVEMQVYWTFFRDFVWFRNRLDFDFVSKTGKLRKLSFWRFWGDFGFFLNSFMKRFKILCQNQKLKRKKNSLIISVIFYKIRYITFKRKAKNRLKLTRRLI